MIQQVFKRIIECDTAIEIRTTLMPSDSRCQKSHTSGAQHLKYHTIHDNYHVIL